MPKRHVTLLGGHGGIGKSSLALGIAAHVACGRDFAGLPVTQSPVVFVSLEDEAAIVRLRLRKVIEAYQLPPQAVLENMRTTGRHRGRCRADGGRIRPRHSPNLHPHL